MLKLMCSGGKDGSGQMELEGSESDKRKQAISSVLEDLSECLTCEAKCSQVCSIFGVDIEAGNLHLGNFLYFIHTIENLQG